jgi:16S rRNA (uracil1498-N3)-methyltransferase
MPRFHCSAPLSPGQWLELPAHAARHVQVLRLQPGAAITLFTGEGGEFEAVVEHMGRTEVRVQVGEHRVIEREAACDVQLAVGMPANERMDWLVEKATELGTTAFWPLVTERSVVKLSGERAQKKRAHWEAIAVAACEQCGRNRIPKVHEVMDLERWFARLSSGARKLLLSPTAQVGPSAATGASREPVIALSGPEGGFSRHEEQRALEHGFIAVNLGARVLRAETAPLALLAALTLRE